ncbi:optineurin-like [Uloborus diversus]|uniref:optineurin-like n=1 Tax=Uloborus diversus TaxID=327109 RepID=UPI00240A042B|nr:optineurin-like [Uloborus diversus]
MSDKNSPEEMASFEVLHTENGSLDENEYSFMPDHSFVSGECVGSNFKQGQSGVSDISTILSAATPDLSIEEIQKRILELLEENASMKEALKRNNIMMEEQLSTISAWHEQMTLSKSQQQEALKKAVESNCVLKKENSELLEKIHNLEEKSNETAERETCSKCTDLQALSHKLEENIDKLMVEKKELCQELKSEKQLHRQLEQNVLEVSNYLENLQSNSKLLEAEKRELTALNNTLQLKLSTLDSDFDTIIQTDEETGYEIVQQRKIKENAMKESLLHLTEAQDEIFKLMKELKLKDNEIESLKRHIDSLSTQLDVPTATSVKTSSELLESEPKAHGNDARCQKLEKEIERYQKDIENLKESDHIIIQKLQKEVDSLQETVKLYQEECKTERLQCNELQRSYDKLQADYERIKKLLEIQSKDEKERIQNIDEYKNHEVKCYLEQIDKLTAQLVDKEQVLEEKAEKIFQLSSELKTVKEDSEMIPILKAQVEVYKGDLQNEVLAKVSAHQEVEKLSEQLKRLQTATEHCSNCAKPLTNGEGKAKIRWKPGKKFTSEHAESNVIRCPVCNNGFTSLQAAENHVNRCLDEPS